MSIVLSIVRYLTACFICIMAGMGFSFLDAFLKCHQAGIDGARTFTSKEILSALDSSLMHFIVDCVDWGGLVRIQGILVFVLVWSLYYSLNAKRNTRETIEVLDIDDGKAVSRQQAKENLHSVREHTARASIGPKLYDQVAY